MCCHAQLILKAQCYVYTGGRTGTTSMNNLQEVNLVFMFMMSSDCKKNVLWDKKCQENTT